MTTVVAAGYCADRVKVVAHSTDDGATWTADASPLDQGFMRDVVWDGTAFVAVGASPNWFLGAAETAMIMTSPDGVTWTKRTTSLDAAGAATCWAVASSPTTLVAIAIDTVAHTLISTDHGVTWATHAVVDPITSVAVNNITDIVYGNGVFVLTGKAGFGSIYAYSSTDGITWAQITDLSTSTSNAVGPVVYENGLFATAGRNDTSGNLSIWTSPTGLAGSWTAHTITSAPSGNVYAIGYGAGLWVVQTDVFDTIGGVSAYERIYTSPTLATWTARYQDRSGNSNNGPSDVLWTGTNLIAGTTGGNSGASGPPASAIIESSGGLTWTRVASPMDPGFSTLVGTCGLAVGGAAPIAPRPLWDVGRRRGT